MRSFLLLITLYLCGPASATEDLFSCATFFEGKIARQARASLRRTLAGRSRAGEAVGIVGLSEKQFLELTNVGKLRVSVPIYLISGENAEAFGRNEAWIGSTYDLLRRRFPDANLEVKRTRQFLGGLRPLLPAEDEMASPAFETITAALENAKVWYLGRGRFARLRRLADLLGLPWERLFMRGGCTERALLTALASLPVETGFCVVIGERARPRLWSKRGQLQLARLSVHDFIEIRPNAATSAAFLDRLLHRRK